MHTYIRENSYHIKKTENLNYTKYTVLQLFYYLTILLYIRLSFYEQCLSDFFFDLIHSKSSLLVFDFASSVTIL